MCETGNHTLDFIITTVNWNAYYFSFKLILNILWLVNMSSTIINMFNLFKKLTSFIFINQKC